jgi:alpha-tubulin suppressor-like RCC1 family protein
VSWATEAAWSRNAPVEGSRGWVEIDGGEGFGCARNAAGRVFCFGTTTSGKLGNGISDGSIRATPVPVVGLVDATVISAGFDHACAIRQGGQVVCWGSNVARSAGHGRNRRHLRHADPVAGDRRHRHLRGLRIHLRAATEPRAAGTA